MTTAAVIIPFRDRGHDPLRVLNLDAVLSRWWFASPWPVSVFGDGRQGDEQFNRSAAYNRGAQMTNADVLIFAESDMLIPFPQIRQAIDLAVERPGLVVPFTEYRYLSEIDSHAVRGGTDPSSPTPERVMANGKSIGAINVVSRHTLDLVGGYTERTDGNWYDDDIMRHAFDHCAGPTRWIDGPAWHLYHQPGWKGDHLTPEDRAATRRNKRLWRHIQTITDPDEIRTALAS